MAKTVIMVFNTSHEPKTQAIPKIKSHNLLLASLIFWGEPPENIKRKAINVAISVAKEALV